MTAEGKDSAPSEHDYGFASHGTMDVENASSAFAELDTLCSRCPHSQGDHAAIRDEHGHWICLVEGCDCIGDEHETRIDDQ